MIACKITNGDAPEYLLEKTKLFQPYCEKPFRRGAGRDTWMFNIDLTEYKISTIISRMITEWNNLPLELRQSDNINIFASSLKTYYFQKAFSS